MEVKRAANVHSPKVENVAIGNSGMTNKEMEIKRMDGVYGPKIIDCAIRNDGKQMYKVKWGCSWETSANLVSYQHLIDEFWSFIHVAKKNHQKILQREQKPEVMGELPPQSPQQKQQLQQPGRQQQHHPQLQQQQQLQLLLQQQQQQLQQLQQLQQQQQLQRQQISSVHNVKTEQDLSNGSSINRHQPERPTEDRTTAVSTGRELSPVNYLNMKCPLAPSMSTPPMSPPIQMNTLQKTPVKTSTPYFPRPPQSVSYSPHTPQPQSPSTPSRSYSPGYTPRPYSPRSCLPLSPANTGASPAYSPEAWSPNPPSPSHPTLSSNLVAVKEERSSQVSKNVSKSPKVQEKSPQVQPQKKSGTTPAQTSLSAVLKFVETFENQYVKLIIVCKFCSKESSKGNWKRHYDSVHGKETPEQRAQYGVKMASTTPQKNPPSKKMKKEKENAEPVVKREELMEQELAFH